MGGGPDLHVGAVLALVQKVSMSRTIGKGVPPSVSASCGQGPTLIIWCTAGVSGMLMPAMSPSLGWSPASMSPPVVRTQ